MPKEIVGLPFEEVEKRRNSFIDRYKDLWTPEGPLSGVGIGGVTLPKGRVRLNLTVYLESEIQHDRLKSLALPVKSYRGVPVAYEIAGEIIAGTAAI